MDYRIITNKTELDSTGYIEIGPGKYSGNHWQDGNLFVCEDAFGLAEGIIMKHYANYDHFSMNDIPYDIGIKIIKDWKNISKRLRRLTPDEAYGQLNLKGPYWDRLDNEIASHKVEILEMLRELADKSEDFYINNKWICILGI